jgi:hypothetical protein
MLKNHSYKIFYIFQICVFGGILLFLTSCRSSDKIKRDTQNEGDDKGKGVVSNDDFRKGYKKGYEEGTVRFLENIDSFSKALKIKSQSTPFTELSGIWELSTLLTKECERQDSIPSNDFKTIIKKLHGIILAYLRDVPGSSYFSVKNEQGGEQKRKNEENLINLYYNDFQKYKKAENLNTGLQGVTLKNYAACDAFGKVLSHNVCNFISRFLLLDEFQITEVLSTPVTFDGICEPVLNLIINPLVLKIREDGYLKDIIETKTLIKEHTRNKIIELGILKDELIIDVDKSYVKKIFDINISRANLKAQVKTRITMGFRLDKFYNLDIDKGNKQIVITVPQPEPLTYENDFKFTNVEHSWAVQIKEAELNEVFEYVKEESLKNAGMNNIWKNAWEHGEKVLESLFQPLVNLPDLNYKLKINIIRKEDQDSFYHDELK